MDQFPAPPIENIQQQKVEVSLDNSSEIAPQAPTSSRFKKFLPFFVIGIFVLSILAGILVLPAGNFSSRAPASESQKRPTATPFSQAIKPVLSPKQSTISGELAPLQKGKIAFIQDGDIYISNLVNSELLIKNKTPAGDKLSWSPSGNFLAWRPKSIIATPSSVTVYNKEKKSSFSISPVKNYSAELLDYVFSPDEKNIAILSHGKIYTISSFSLSSPSSSPSAVLLRRALSVKKIFWPQKNTIIFSGEDGISTIDTISSKKKSIVDSKKIVNMKLSPMRDKLLFSIGDKKKTDLYLVNIDGTGRKLIEPKPDKIDMGSTSLPIVTLDRGFIPYALFMPLEDRLLVGHRYKISQPLVGIYNLKRKSFVAIAPFLLRKNDILIKDMLIGERINTEKPDSAYWQISIYSLKDNKFEMVGAIPNSFSPAFVKEHVEDK